jgi:2'-5' RNA ligase
VTGYRDHHATIFLPPRVAEPVEAVRREWDPLMAEQIPAHVTLAYPQEAPVAPLLVARLRAASATAAPFRLRLGTPSYFDRPEGGVYIGVEDVDCGYRRLRAEVLYPPFRPAVFPPHVTLVHPRTSPRGREFWERGRYQVGAVDFSVEEVGVTAFDGTTWLTLATFALGRRA